MAPRTRPDPFADDPARGWDSDALDLDAYLDALGLTGPLGPDRESVAALHRAHSAALSFANTDVVLGRGVSLDVADIQDKLVARRRGGYCYEHNILLAAALERIGVRAIGHAARIRVGDRFRPATHMLLSMELGGERFIADVGFGGGGLREPMPYAAGAEVAQGDGKEWAFRIDTEEAPGDAAEPRTRVLTARSGDRWTDLYSFTGEPSYRNDYAIFNHYLCTHPRSPFRARLMAQRLGEGVSHRLANTELSTEHPDGTTDTRELTRDEVPEALRDVFGLRLDPEDARAVADAAVRLAGSGRG
ncbi:arylamine N-acetyltransferase [Nocardiopsis sp. RSe5-2]|uniref:Arylamine N-acetyltransferase n=1 Tax=Nocardiopsis endophytica TaxID=3018445 RepID=A0ABT4U3P2_9ACTN|nr:arylamine N-acetyltransferase [Nocardiopsis endophytica]MDA2811576.1 arylamine N-acetyltransferase [Nocardiopsis endophytica]